MSESDCKCVFDPQTECLVRRFLAGKKVQMEQIRSLLEPQLKTPLKQEPSEEFQNIMGITLDKYLAKVSAMFQETNLGEFCIACMLKRLIDLQPAPAASAKVKPEEPKFFTA